MKKILYLLIFLFVLKIVFFIISPIFRFGDDIRYLASSKTILIKNNILPDKDFFTNNVIWYPLLFIYTLSSLSLLSFGNNFLWFNLSKIFELIFFFGCIVIILKILKRLNFSENKKILCLLIFSLYPISMFLSTSIMLDFPLTFFTLLMIWFVFFEKNYFVGSIITGFLVIIKSTGILLVISSITSIILFEKNKINKTKYLIYTSLFFVIISGFWIYNNYIKFGTLIYDPWTISEIELYKDRPFLSKLFYGYLSLWGLPPSYRISSRLNISNDIIIFLQAITLLFLLPLTYFFFYGFIKNYKKIPYFIPFILIISFLGIYYFFKVTFSDISRYIFPIFPMLCIYFSQQFNLNKKIFRFYIFFILFLFVLVSFGLQLYMLNKEKNITSSLINIIEKNKDKEIFVFFKDKEIIWILNLYYNIETKTTDEICSDFLVEGPINYCHYSDRIVIFRQYKTIDYGETIIPFD